MLTSEYSRRHALAMLAAAGQAPAVLAERTQKPNIVLILTDDHGTEYAGCYGNSRIRTPNIDALASSGQKSTRMLTPTAMCTPSRSALFTGLYPHGNGAHPNHSQIRSGIRTLPQQLQTLGYRTVLAGKRHVAPESSFPFEYIPLQSAADFVRKPGKGPVFLAVCTNDPHAPFRKQPVSRPYNPEDVTIPPYLVDTPETRREMVEYYNSVEAADRQTGEILRALQLSGLEEDTVTIYASDHGAEFPFSKWTLYDAGLRVPFIVRWPGRVKPGSTCGALCSFVDLLPTFLRIAGGTEPDGLDGESLLDAWQGRTGQVHDRVFGTHTNAGIIQGSDYPIRTVRTHQFQYIRNLKPGNRFTNLITSNADGIQAEAGAYWPGWIELGKTNSFAAKRSRLYQTRPGEELYDVKADPFELNNLAGSGAHRTQIEGLRAELRRWMEQQGDPLIADLASSGPAQ